MTTTPRSGADVLASIRPQLRRRRLSVCLRPDLLDAWEDANAELADAASKDRSAPRLAAGTVSPATKEKAEQVQAIEAEIEATQLWVEFEAMPSDKWAALTEKHPPRKGNEADLFFGYNRDTVIEAAVRLCMVDPVFDDASWTEFRRVCNPAEWNELKRAVNEVNGVVTDAPKSVLAASVLTKRDAASKSPKNGESAPASSRAGRRAKSTSTTTPTET